MTTATMTEETIETTTAQGGHAAPAKNWTPTADWFLAGTARFTVSNPRGEHYSYRIDKKESRTGESIWFLSVLSGPDNESDDCYRYLGVVGKDGSIRTTSKSRGCEEYRSFKVAAWALKRVWSGKALPDGYGISHAGCCARCGRTLTRPEGTDLNGYRYGFGPVCWEKVQEDRQRRAAREAYKAPTAEDRMAEAVARLEANMARAESAAREALTTDAAKLEAWRRDHERNVKMVALYGDLDAQRHARINREMIEEQEAQHGMNPLY